MNENPTPRLSSLIPIESSTYFNKKFVGSNLKDCMSASFLRKTSVRKKGLLQNWFVSTENPSSDLDKLTPDGFSALK